MGHWIVGAGAGGVLEGDGREPMGVKLAADACREYLEDAAMDRMLEQREHTRSRLMGRTRFPEAMAEARLLEPSWPLAEDRAAVVEHLGSFSSFSVFRPQKNWNTL